jgi:hypothetical protein
VNRKRKWLEFEVPRVPRVKNGPWASLTPNFELRTDSDTNH